ncbi:hypothetical protein VNO78_35019 [Psophocarpus tetragonolobus]|uniref:ABCC10-like N-terminal domain-containing protein n=1 Tax=Psophocarpus tetragonolobus TaxID=3891 RepID=A0AAN9NPF7_PSOTE
METRGEGIPSNHAESITEVLTDGLQNVSQSIPLKGEMQRVRPSSAGSVLKTKLDSLDQLVESGIEPVIESEVSNICGDTPLSSRAALSVRRESVCLGNVGKPPFHYDFKFLKDPSTCSYRFLIICFNMMLLILLAIILIKKSLFCPFWGCNFERTRFSAANDYEAGPSNVHASNFQQATDISSQVNADMQYTEVLHFVPFD